MDGQGFDTSPRPAKRRRNGKPPKRAPYVAAACDQCHGRKLRCSGTRPCMRCVKGGVVCSYPMEDPARSTPRLDAVPGRAQTQNDHEDLLSTIETLQKQLERTKEKLELDRKRTSLSQTPRVPTPPLVAEIAGASTQSHAVKERTPDYAGPTGSTFSIEKADTRLSNIPDLASGSLPGDNPYDHTHLPSPERSEGVEPVPPLTVPSLETIEKYVEIFQCVFGVLHPLNVIEKFKGQIRELHRVLIRSFRSYPTVAGECGVLEMFKIVIATSIVCEAGTETPLSRALYNSVEPIINALPFARTVSHEFRLLLLLAGIYHCCLGGLVMASRMVMLAERTALEEGLYQRARLQVKHSTGEAQRPVINLLWSLFALDRQFNYAAGLPSTLDENDIDLPRPIDASYLGAVIDYGIFGAYAFFSVVKPQSFALGQGPPKDALDFFRYKLQQWQQSLHPKVRFEVDYLDGLDFMDLPSRDWKEIYVKTLLYLRFNQIQLVCLRPMLIYPKAVRANLALAKEAAATASKSLRVLGLMSEQANDFYRIRQVVWNHFLASALATLLLAAVYDVEARIKDGDVDVEHAVLRDSIVELQLGFQLVDALPNQRPWQRFNRVRQHLVRLGFLGTGNNGDSFVSTEAYQERFGNTAKDELDAFLLFPSDGMGLQDREFQGETLNMDWFDVDFSESLEQFGMPSWS